MSWLFLTFLLPQKSRSPSSKTGSTSVGWVNRLMILAINGRTYKELTSATNYEAIGRYQKVANSKWLFFFFPLPLFNQPLLFSVVWNPNKTLVTESLVDLLWWIHISLIAVYLKHGPELDYRKSIGK